jgi:hypothetical protein
MKRFLLALSLCVVYLAGHLTPPPTSLSTWRNPFIWSQLFTGVPVLATYTPTPFRTVQLRTLAVSSVPTTNDTITSVDTTWTVLVNMGAVWDLSSSFNAIACFLTSSTNVACKVDPGGAGTGTARYAVLEFLPGIPKSVQACTISITNGNSSNTCTITSVSTSKSWLSYMGYRSTDSNGASTSELGTISLTSGTTVTGVRGGTTGAGEISAFVVEGK